MAAALQQQQQQRKERLILAVDYAVQQALGDINKHEPSNRKWTASPEFVLALCEVVSSFASGPVQTDLVAFAGHAKRRTVTVEDVQLVARKSPALAARIGKFTSETAQKKTQQQQTRINKKKQKVSDDVDEFDEEDGDDRRISRTSSTGARRIVKDDEGNGDETEEEYVYQGNEDDHLFAD